MRDSSWVETWEVNRVVVEDRAEADCFEKLPSGSDSEETAAAVVVELEASSSFVADSRDSYLVVVWAVV